MTLLSHVQTTYRQKDLEKLGIGYSMFIEIEHLVLKNERLKTVRIACLERLIRNLYIIHKCFGIEISSQSLCYKPCQCFKTHFFIQTMSKFVFGV